MITQYSWASVKDQQRKHIEYGMMITLSLAIITFYVSPDFGVSTPVIEEYLAPPIDVLNIPATTQPPEHIKPLTPTIPVESEEALDMDIDLPWADDIDGYIPVNLIPPEPPIAPVSFWAVQVKPEPIGGYAAIMNNVIYPEIARAAGMQGRVTLEALIGVDGIVKDIKIIKGQPRTGLDDAAMDAVSMTRFTPAYQRDKPVPVWMSISINFSLK